jgi:hypothetical protein
MLTKELLAKWVAQRLKSMWLNIGENLIGEFCVSNDEDYEVAEEVVN